MAFNPKEHMITLRGSNRQYLQVMWRIVWFREEHPDWSIVTNLVSHDPEKMTAVFKAEIIDPRTEHVLSTGYGSESIRDFKDYLEKAETKAIGRALAMLGYGTQFAPELDEGERIVDSPVDTSADVEALRKMLGEMGIKEIEFLESNGIRQLEDMTLAQIDYTRRVLEDRRNNKANRGHPVAVTA